MGVTVDWSDPNNLGSRQDIFEQAESSWTVGESGSLMVWLNVHGTETLWAEYPSGRWLRVSKETPRAARS